MYKNIAIVLLLIICFGFYAEDRQRTQENAWLQYSVKDIAAFNQEYFSKHNLDWNDYLASVEQRIANEKTSKCSSALELYYDICKSCTPPPSSEDNKSDNLENQSRNDSKD